MTKPFARCTVSGFDGARKRGHDPGSLTPARNGVEWVAYCRTCGRSLFVPAADYHEQRITGGMLWRQCTRPTTADVAPDDKACQ